MIASHILFPARPMLPSVLLAALAVLAFLLPPAPAPAQNLFSPAARVNDRVISQYELDQRIRFAQLLRAPGDPRKESLKALINERLQMQAAESMGITASDEMIQTGMEEFAARANLTADQFTQALAAGGVARETFRDFVRAGILWREVVRTRFGPRVQVSDAEVDRALALSASRTGGLRVLLSEIILPAPPQQAAEAQRLAERLSRITAFGTFAAAARQYSASASRATGGRLPWMPLANLPPRIRGQILALSPGEVTAPIPIPNGIALFQLRAIEETELPEPTNVTVEYARYLLSGNTPEALRREAARVAARADSCDDLYGLNKGRPEAALERIAQPLSQVPEDIAMELAKLDENEFSPPLQHRGGGVLLMLCARVPELPEEISRDDIRNQLLNQALAQYADGYLAQLRADAVIEVFGQ